MKNHSCTLVLSLALILVSSACNPGAPAANPTATATAIPLPSATQTQRPPTSTATATRQPGRTPQPTVNVLDAVAGTIYAGMTATAEVRPTVPTRTPGPTTDPARIGAGTPVPVSQCQRDVTGLLALHDVEADSNFFSGETNPTGKPGSFDAESTFQVLNRLSMPPGYRLDYVYYQDGLGGRPLLYARKIDQSPFQSYAEYIEAIGGGREQHSYEELDNAYDYLKFLRSDDTSAGYFQYVAMATMGNQFYLWWHALYNDFRILCSQDDLEEFQQQLAAFGVGDELKIPPEVMEKASKIDYTPTVHLTADSATVRVVGFSKWGGLIEEYFTLSRKFPHDLLDSGYQILAEWDCGISF